MKYKIKYMLWRWLIIVSMYFLWFACLLFHKHTLIYIATWYQHHVDFFNRKNGERVKDFYK